MATLVGWIIVLVIPVLVIAGVALVSEDLIIDVIRKHGWVKDRRRIAKRTIAAFAGVGSFFLGGYAIKDWPRQSWPTVIVLITGAVSLIMLVTRVWRWSNAKDNEKIEL